VAALHRPRVGSSFVDSVTNLASMPEYYRRNPKIPVEDSGVEFWLREMDSK
jgi:hypothetical protein